MNHENIENKLLSFTIRERIDSMSQESRIALLESIIENVEQPLDIQTQAIILYIRQSINNYEQ
jgi:hypothetical protein